MYLFYRKILKDFAAIYALFISIFFLTFIRFSVGGLFEVNCSLLIIPYLKTAYLKIVTITIIFIFILGLTIYMYTTGGNRAHALRG